MKNLNQILLKLKDQVQFGEDIKMENEERSKINTKVFGCGKSGMNIAQKIYELSIPGTEIVDVSEDALHLIETTANKKVLVGMNITKGLGGYSLESIERDLIESDSNIRNILNGYNIAIITAGLGGRYSSVIPAYISRVAKEINPDGIVIGVVTMPLSAEGKIRKDNAQYGLKKMLDVCDTIILFSLDSIINIYNKFLMDEIFQIADEILKEIIYRMIETINQEIGENRRDELREIFKKGKVGTIGIGESDDQLSRIRKATEEALNSPLIFGDLKEANTVLLMIISDNDIPLSETKEAEVIIKEIINISSTLKTYSFVDSNLKDYVRVIIFFLG